LILFLSDLDPAFDLVDFADNLFFFAFEANFFVLDGATEDRLRASEALLLDFAFGMSRSVAQFTTRLLLGVSVSLW